MSFSYVRGFSEELADIFDPLSTHSPRSFTGNPLPRGNGMDQSDLLREAILRIAGLHEVIETDDDAVLDEDQCYILEHICRSFRTAHEGDNDVNLERLHEMMAKANNGTMNENALIMSNGSVKRLGEVIGRMNIHTQINIATDLILSSWFKGYFLSHQIAASHCWKRNAPAMEGFTAQKLMILPVFGHRVPLSRREVISFKEIHASLVANRSKPLPSDMNQVVSSLPDIQQGRICRLKLEETRKLLQMLDLVPAANVNSRANKPWLKESDLEKILPEAERKPYNLFCALVVLGVQFQFEYWNFIGLRAMKDSKLCTYPEGRVLPLKESTAVIKSLAILQDMPDDELLALLETHPMLQDTPTGKNHHGENGNCTCAIDGLREGQIEIMKTLPGFDELFVAWSDATKTNYIIGSIKEILTERNYAFKKRDEALRKNNTLIRKSTQREQVLVSAQEISDNRVQELHERIQSMSLTIDSKDSAIQTQKQEVEKVKEAFYKKLQASFDKSRGLDNDLMTEKVAHQVTKLDLSASEVDREKERGRVAKLKNVWTENSEKYNIMKAQNKEYETELRTLRTNDTIIQDRIKAAVRESVVVKDAEIAQKENLITEQQTELTQKNAALENLKNQNFRLSQENHTANEAARKLNQEAEGVFAAHWDDMEALTQELAAEKAKNLKLQRELAVQKASTDHSMNL